MYVTKKIHGQKESICLLMKDLVRHIKGISFQFSRKKVSTNCNQSFVKYGDRISIHKIIDANEYLQDNVLQATITGKDNLN